jgi:hypothetical protein
VRPGYRLFVNGSAYVAGSTNYIDGRTIFRTEGASEIARLESSGRLGIGVSAPAATLDAVAESTNGFGVRIRGRASDGFGALQFTSNDGSSQTASLGVASNTLVISTANSERARIDSSGRLLVGTSTAVPSTSNAGGNTFCITGSQTLFRSSSDINSQYIEFVKQRAGGTVVNSGDRLGQILFEGHDGTNPIRAAEISSFVDGTPGANDMPGRLCSLLLRMGRVLRRSG